MRVKNLFFDRPAVQRAIDPARRRALSKAGAFVRQRAKTSMRKRRGTSRPGQPPFAHEGSLRRMVLFGYDPRTESVVVGPVGFRRNGSSGGAPSVLEFGGRATVVRRRGGKRTKQAVRIAARPYMRPALEKEASNLPKVWRNSVRGG